MSVLLVGGTGLISTGITRELLARGDAVTVFNRGQTALDVAGAAGRLRQLTGDRTDLLAFETTIAGAGSFDCIIDMRCFTPAEAASAVRAYRGRTAQVIFCSTVDVYAKPASRYPVVESEPRLASGPFAYAVHKVACEELLEEARARGDFNLTIIRPAHTYGEGGRVVHPLGFATTFVDRLRKGKPVIVHGDGTSLWTSCHRDDVARAFVGAVGNAATYGRAYHATGEEWQTWNRYVEQVAEAAGATAPTIVHIPTDLLRAVAPVRAFWCAENFSGNNIFDNSAARADLGFRYAIPFLDGMRRTIAWLDARPDRRQRRRLGAGMAAQLADLEG